MSYIAVDTFGDEYIYSFKPKRVIYTSALGENGDIGILKRSSN